MYKQASNPTWIPVSVVLVLGFFLPIVGYIFLKNALEIDKQNQVYELMSTIQFSKLNYILGKFISNCLLLFILWIVIIVGTFFMVLLQFPGKYISAAQFFTPFSTLIPGIFIISAISIFTEVTPILRGFLGTILVSFFFLLDYIFSATYYNVPFLRIVNPSGSGYLFKMIEDTSVKTSGHYLGQTMLLSGGSIHQTGSKELVFSPIYFNKQDFNIFFYQLLICIVLILLAAWFFSPHHYRNNVFLNNRKSFKGKLRSTKNKSSSKDKDKDVPEWQPVISESVHWLPLLSATFLQLWRTLSLFNKLALLILWIVAWFSSFPFVQQIIFPLFLLMELPFLSNLGAQATKSGFFDWLKTISFGQKRQQISEYVSGLLFTLVLLLPLMTKSLSSLVILVCFAVFLCSLAQFLGFLTKSNRPFIFLLVMFCFIYLNGATKLLPLTGNNLIMELIYLSLAIILFLLKKIFKLLFR
ncbi:hypothetical protein [Bombilactobacillus bombi]|uniref:hypothetical protein n=1 Tax=Bombilactobacillus bombi TaxID=1303590 RepID=UPI0015E5EB3A|nr:hypothetical protein [Bombilactobacillus bombi]